MTASASVSSAAVAKNKSKLSASTPGTQEGRSVSDSETGAEWDEFGINGSALEDEDGDEEEDEFTNVPAFFLHRYNPLQVETRAEDATNISNWRVANRVRSPPRSPLVSSYAALTPLLRWLQSGALTFTAGAHSWHRPCAGAESDGCPAGCAALAAA